jgi:DNA repair protein RecN (Recombination protein N)
MITYLKVRNLAIVEEFAVEPGPGLNVLTGETGAGKSLLIDSIEFLRGARGSSEMIRSGTDRMTAEAVFHLPGSAGEALEEMGIDAGGRVDETIELIVKREIAVNGRGRVLINGSPFSVRQLGEAMEAFVEIHGQHESHSRVAGQGYRELLDDFGDHGALLESTRAAHGQWHDAANEFRALADAQRDRTLRLDLLRYQIDEIAAAKIVPAEEDALRVERSMLANARQLAEATSGAFALVDDDEASAIAQLSKALHLVQPLAREIAEISVVASELEEAIYRLQETSRGLARLSDSVRHDPERLEEIEDRLVTIERLKKKYGGSVEAVLVHLSAIQDEFERLSDYEANIDKLQRIEEQRFLAWRNASATLSTARKKAAKRFEAAIQSELNDLAMEGTTVKVRVDAIEPAREHATAHGIDRIEILIAPNRGEEPKAMQRIASGGELSRIQLAIAAALFKASHQAATATLVFDEIDAGIGGRVAEVVGRKLQELAAGNQVICVTHLPQIASFGATHFFVWKEDAEDHTRARIRRLDSDEERVNEIARMLGGESVPASAVLHARELLDGARSRTARARR